MRNKTAFRSVLIGLLFTLCSIPGIAQTADTVGTVKDSAAAAELGIGADIVSRYVWRGKACGTSPAIQPGITFSYSGLKIGVWGTYDFTHQVNAGSFPEFDPNISYTWKWFTVGINDYYSVDELDTTAVNRFFNYSAATTNHTLEGYLSFTGPESFPLTVFAGTLFFGADKGAHPRGIFEEGEKNNYSTYIEVSYPFSVFGADVNAFVGGIPYGSGWYGPNGGIINAGFTLSKSIRITDSFELPVFLSLITNPQTQNVFLVFGLSL